MDYDYFVIGGGSGGVRAARLAGARGLKVGLAEYDQLGGTCVIRGCVPKKLMVYSASYAGLFEESVGFGWSVGEATFNWPTLRDRMANEINRLSGIYERNLRLANVEIIPQHASLAGPNRIKLADGTELSAEKILIATGGRPFVPEGLQGSELALISDDLFIEQLPR
jgi:Pyruvate/2-oxoglutarate dehydrogenase complex, dihydrolipoamide dehydrogenase (E3) component, and related enzymes